MTEFNIVGPKFEPTDISLFTSFEEEKTGVVPALIHLIEEDKTMAHLLARLGKFKSVGEAKRNGWDKPIPNGWHEIIIGKGINRDDFFIWNPVAFAREYED